MTMELSRGAPQQFPLRAKTVLFVLIGLEFAVITFPPGSLAVVVLVVALCLLARYLVVGAPATVWRQRFGLPPGSGLLMTWSGVRGGISVALALSTARGYRSRDHSGRRMEVSAQQLCSLSRGDGMKVLVPRLALSGHRVENP